MIKLDGKELRVEVETLAVRRERGGDVQIDIDINALVQDHIGVVPSSVYTVDEKGRRQGICQFFQYKPTIVGEEGKPELFNEFDPEATAAWELEPINENGQYVYRALKRQSTFEDDFRNGTEFEWDDDGKLSAIRHFTKGKQDRTEVSFYYDMNGDRRVRYSRWRDGEQIETPQEWEQRVTRARAEHKKEERKARTKSAHETRLEEILTKGTKPIGTRDVLKGVKR